MQAEYTPIPTRWVGPLKVSGNAVTGEFEVPLASYETPLWPSVRRGAKVSTFAATGIVATVIDERMTRSILIVTPGAQRALEIASELRSSVASLQDEVVSAAGRFVRLIDIHFEIVGNLLYLRNEFTTGDASGHNMVTLASEKLVNYILARYRDTGYGSISANLCSDKKATAVNGLLGRGKNVVTELLIPGKIVSRFLHTTADRVATLNVRKNLIGTTLAGGIRSANAHYANMLLAFYLATGQDAANIVEGSQGITHAEDRDGDLYFSCTLPNLIVGSVGNGKDLPVVQAALERLGCTQEREPGANSRQLAALCAATVLCGELSLLAAQTNPGELMQAHVSMERSSSK